MSQETQREVMAEVKKHYLAKSSKGTPSVKIQIELTTGETMYYDCWLTDSCYKQTIKTLREALKWNGSNLSDLDNTGIFAGQKVSAVIDEEEYEGVTRNKVKFLNSVGGRGQSIDAAELDDVQNDFDMALKNYGKNDEVNF